MIILFEGIDGSGKTSAALLLEKVLKKKYNVKYYREPGSGFLGELSRFLISKGQFSQTSNMLLYLLSRSDNIDNIVNDSKDNIILLDRFSPSTIAYQGLLFNHQIIYDFEKIIRKNTEVDYVFHLYCGNIQTYLNRQEKRDNLNLTNSTKRNLIDYYGRLTSSYEKAYSLLNYNNIYNIDTEHCSVISTAKHIYETIKKDCKKYEK